LPRIDLQAFEFPFQGTEETLVAPVHPGVASRRSVD
jgi:hypothetical protein